jgi:hypothetical protein
MMGMLDGAAQELLEDESAAQDFDFGSRVVLPWEDEAELERQGLAHPGEIVEAFYRGVPVLVPGSTERPDQGFSTELLRRRDGMLWARIEAPYRGPAFFAAYGLYAIIEQTARAAPYEAITVPAVAGVAALTHMYFEVIHEHGWESFVAMSMLEDLAVEVAMADDPRQALEVLRQRGLSS